MTTQLTHTLTTLAAQTDPWGPGGHWGWWPGPWFLIFPLLFWTTVVVLFVVFGRRWRRRQDGEGTLADVFARGEITEAEYRSRLAVLRENRR